MCVGSKSWGEIGCSVGWRLSIAWITAIKCEVSSYASALKAFIEKKQDEDRCLLDVSILGAPGDTEADPVGSRVGKRSNHRD